MTPPQAHFLNSNKGGVTDAYIVATVSSASDHDIQPVPETLMQRREGANREGVDALVGA